jgi:hypothetical protein
MHLYNEIPYSLAKEGKSSDSFYDTVDLLTDEFLKIIPKNIESITSEFSSYLNEKFPDSVRSESEYYVELLMLGVFWMNYSSVAETTPAFGMKFLSFLYKLRRKYRQYKKQIDWLRGFGISFFYFGIKIPRFVFL